MTKTEIKEHTPSNISSLPSVSELEAAIKREAERHRQYELEVQNRDRQAIERIKQGTTQK